MIPSNTFYAAYAFVYGPDGAPTVKYARHGIATPQEALREAQEHAADWQGYEVRIVTAAAYDHWARSDHSQPAHGQPVYGGFAIPLAS